MFGTFLTLDKYVVIPQNVHSIHDKYVVIPPNIRSIHDKYVVILQDFKIFTHLLPIFRIKRLSVFSHTHLSYMVKYLIKFIVIINRR
jgi:hypothetical protein